MQLQQTEDQTALLDALAKLVAQTKLEPLDGRRTFFNQSLDAALDASGLLDAAGMEGFGAVAAALLVEQLARLPAIAEIGASAFIRPLMCPDWPRPLAVLPDGIGRPARFLCEAGTVVFIGTAGARIVRLEPADATPCESFFTYPMGRLVDPAGCYARSVPAGDSTDMRRLYRLATACELAGALQGALETVTGHVTNRRQFGRTLGSFQAIQHRLAGNATKIVAGRLLIRRAADLGTASEALLALGYVQDCAAGILYDLHQFMGAMGLTLEHPLYRWSYRVKLLLSELGGSSRNFGELATALWGEPHPIASLSR